MNIVAFQRFDYVTDKPQFLETRVKCLAKGDNARHQCIDRIYGCLSGVAFQHSRYDLRQCFGQLDKVFFGHCFPLSGGFGLIAFS